MRARSQRREQKARLPNLLAPIEQKEWVDKMTVVSCLREEKGLQVVRIAPVC